MHERRLTSFNVLFDGGWLAREFGWLPWEMCSYGLFRQLATEAYEGQRWNLATLQTEVLGYADHNKDPVDDMLRKHGLGKEDMWRLLELEPTEFLKYCALDAEAHWHGYSVLLDACEDLGVVGDALADYHIQDFLNEVELLAEAQFLGIPIDQEKLTAYRTELERKIEDGLAAFHQHADIAPLIKLFNVSTVNEHLKEKPATHTKVGKPAAAYDRWVEKLEQYQQMNFFNVRASKHLIWLFYDKLGYPVRKYTKDPKTKQRTMTPATDKECLLFFGEPGKILFRVKKLMTELNHVKVCLDNVRFTPSIEEYWDSYHAARFGEGRGCG